MTRKKLVLGVIVMGVLGLVLAPIDYADDALWRALFDAGHFPLLGFVTMATFVALRPSGLGHGMQLLRAGVVGVVIALLIELVQPLVSRTASVADIVNGVLGVAAAVACIAAWRKNAALALRLLCAVCVVGGLGVSLWPAYQELRADRWNARSYPQLAGFEQSFERRLWRAHGSKGKRPQLAISTDQASEGKQSLRVKTRGKSWNSIGHSVGHADWSKAKAFALDVYTAGTLERIGVNVVDRHGAKFGRWVPLSAGWTHVMISVEDLRKGSEQRGLALDSIRYVTLAVPQDDPAQLYYIDNVRVIE